jgi:hypothetical protein
VLFSELLVRAVRIFFGWCSSQGISTNVPMCGSCLVFFCLYQLWSNEGIFIAALFCTASADGCFLVAGRSLVPNSFLVAQFLSDFLI